MSISGINGLNTAFSNLKVKTQGDIPPEFFALLGEETAKDKNEATATAAPAITPLSGQSLLDAQNFGQKDENKNIFGLTSADTKTEIGETGKKEESAVYEEFRKWAEMTPAERIRAQVLEEEGVSEEEFSKLDAKEQQRIIEKIRQRVEAVLKDDMEAIA